MAMVQEVAASSEDFKFVFVSESHFGAFESKENRELLNKWDILNFQVRHTPSLSRHRGRALTLQCLRRYRYDQFFRPERGREFILALLNSEAFQGSFQTHRPNPVFFTGDVKDVELDRLRVTVRAAGISRL